MRHHNFERQSLCIIGVRYYLSAARFERVITKLHATFREHFHHIDVLVYDLEGAVKSLEARRYSYRDVNGYWFDMSGFKMSVNDQTPADGYLYFNDTLFKKHPSEFFINRMVSLSPLVVFRTEPSIAGEVNPSTDIVFDEVNQHAGKHVSTHFFLLNKQSNSVFVELLCALPETHQVGDWLESLNNTFPRLKAILEVSVFGPQNPWSWKREMGSIQKSVLERKSVTIAVEHMLSARVIEAGGCLIPINFGVTTRVLRLIIRCRDAISRCLVK